MNGQSFKKLLALPPAWHFYTCEGTQSNSANSSKAQAWIWPPKRLRFPQGFLKEKECGALNPVLQSLQPCQPLTIRSHST